VRLIQTVEDMLTGVGFSGNFIKPDGCFYRFPLGKEEPLVVLAAAKLGLTRLIDNLEI